MSRKQLLSSVAHELTRINKQIDYKIVKGLSYERDALRHKMLLAQLTRAGHRERFSRIFGFLSLL